jgi:hypothetical protein
VAVPATMLHLYFLLGALSGSQVLGFWWGKKLWSQNVGYAVMKEAIEFHIEGLKEEGLKGDAVKGDGGIKL